MSFPALVPFAVNQLLPDPSGRPDGATYMGGALTRSRGVVFHVNQGNGNPRNWWTSPANHNVASAHLQIMKDGTLLQYVPLNRIAWAEVNGNGEWHSVETEGFDSEPLTGAQHETFAKLLAWGSAADTCGWQLVVTDSVTGYGVGTHQMGGAAWGGHACPGSIRAAQRPSLIARAKELTTPGGFLMALSDSQQAELYNWVKGMTTVTNGVGSPTPLTSAVGDIFVHARQAAAAADPAAIAAAVLKALPSGSGGVTQDQMTAAVKKALAEVIASGAGS